MKTFEVGDMQEMLSLLKEIEFADTHWVLIRDRSEALTDIARKVRIFLDEHEVTYKGKVPK